MAIPISINEFKRLGANIIDQQLKTDHEIIVTSHGKNKYAIIEYSELLKIQEERLELAYLKVCEQIDKGQSFAETAEEHIKRLEKQLVNG